MQATQQKYFVGTDGDAMALHAPGENRVDEDSGSNDL